jgi:hypothetical protein
MKENKIIDLLKQKLKLNVKKIELSLEYKEKVPFLLKKSYEISTIQIEDLKCVLLIVNDNKLSLIKKHIELFSKALEFPIIIYIQNITSSRQKYFIDKGISFISKTSIYLPQLLIYLSDITYKQKQDKKKNLSKLAQQIIIYSIVKNCKTDIEIQNTAKIFHVTNMSASRALKELSEQGFFFFHELGRKKIYALKKDLSFNHLISLLKNPKIEEFYLKEKDLFSLKNKYLSSYSALSNYTNITNIQKIYAIDKKYFDKQRAKIVTYEEQYDNELSKIELWSYVPISNDDNTVDPISLYMLLMDELDEEDTRVINAMTELKEKIEGMII